MITLRDCARSRAVLQLQALALRQQLYVLARIDLLKSIGIEKGQPFNPDERLKAILNAAASDACGYQDARYEEVFQPLFDASARWALTAS